MSDEEWNHSKVFRSLIERGDRQKDSALKPPYYVTLYPQSTNAALMYDESVAAPVHINEYRVNLRFWAEIKPFLELISVDSKGAGRESQNFGHYRVSDWNAFAKILGL
jgi:hypothetical protein